MTLILISCQTNHFQSHLSKVKTLTSLANFQSIDRPLKVRGDTRQAAELRVEDIQLVVLVSVSTESGEV